MNDTFMKLGSGALVLLLVVALALFIPYACQSPETARKTLQDNGYTHIEITGYRWFICDEKDTFSTGFKAVTPSGKQVSGAVCSGFLKGNTIRFD
jgi:hypothetical protein